MNDITVVIPTSPIPIHPSPEIIVKVLESVRYHLPDAPIHILADGVRPEVEHRRQQYGDYLVRLKTDYHKKFGEVYLNEFHEHRQQAGMLRHILPEIKTKALLFIEHDATLDQKPIPWEQFCGLLELDAARTIRLYWHVVIHPEHTHLMLERAGDFVPTLQWSGWPHIVRTDFCKQLMDRYFQGDDCKMLETVLYGPCIAAPWEDFRTVIYAPEPDAIRFHHLNGRVDPVTGTKDAGSW